MLAIRDPIQCLRQVLAGREAGGWQMQDVVYVLKTAAREVLPAYNLRGRCASLELFSDWVVHEQLDRSPKGAEALVEIAKALPLHGTGGRDNGWLEEVVNRALSFSALRLDLVGFCRHFNLPEVVFTEWERWLGFAVSLAFEVSGHPISISEKAGRVKAAQAAMSQVPLAQQHRPTSLRLAVDQEARKCWWLVQLPVAEVQIQVLFGGFRPSDFPTPQGWTSPLQGCAIPMVTSGG